MEVEDESNRMSPVHTTLEFETREDVECPGCEKQVPMRARICPYCELELD